MKISGKTFDGPRIQTVVIPRDGQDVIFRAQAVLDYEVFDKACPRPTPPMKLYPGKTAAVPDTQDKDYQLALDAWATKRTAFMVIESLKATEELEWDTVTADPDTWENYMLELTSAGFSPVEINKILETVFDANGLNQDKIEQATKRFLAGQAGQSTEE